MATGPIPASAATAHGMGVNAQCDNTDAEKQMASPKYGEAPSTVSEANENSAAEQQAE